MEIENIHTTPGRALGKRAPVDRKSVSFGDFLKTIPSIPLIDAAPHLNYPMDGNDAVGDCVVAGWDHSRQVIRNLLIGAGVNFTQEQIWAFYKTQNPNFNPNGTASTNGPGSNADCGMNIQLFLEYLVAQKYILAFGSINYRNEQELKAAVYLGLSVMTGVQLQQAQQDQFANGVWEYVPGSPIDGGHCINLVGFNATPDQTTCVTWGKLVQCTQNFINHQMDEAWFILTQEHVDHPGFRNAFDLKGFADAVYSLTEGKVVVPVPSSPPSHAYAFTRLLKLGMSGQDVMELQKRLATEIAPDGGMCYRYMDGGKLYFGTYFGQNTQDALQRYQAQHGIVSHGTPITTGYGQLGPTTIKTLNGSEVQTGSKVEKWADAIQAHEGWYAPGSVVAGVSYPTGSVSYRNNNPGNLKYIGQNLATGKDAGGFCIFANYANGRQTLVDMLTLDCTGGSSIYSPTMSLLQYYQKYSPDGTSAGYAADIAKRMGVLTTTLIGTFANS